MAEVTVVAFPGEATLWENVCGDTSAEGSFAWFRVLAETTLRAEDRAIVVLVRDDRGEIRAALPLVKIGQTGLRALTAPYTTQYVPALADIKWANVLGRSARDFVHGYLRLDSLDPEDQGVMAFISGLNAAGLVTARYRHFVNWYETVTDFGSYWKRRPSRLQTTVRRRLAHAPSPEFRCLRTTGELEEAVATYQNIYRSSWKPPEPHQQFIPAMVRALGAEGLVRLGIMYLKGEPVAVQIWLVCNGKATIFKLAHRDDAARHSPGTLLTRWMIEKLMGEEKLEEIDFGRGDDAYKRDWLNQSRIRTGLIAANLASQAGLSTLVREVFPTRFGNAVRAGANVAVEALQRIRHPFP
jgi:CelD/BcsL family acetyltransferase involved in cellulose biosynthesis